MPHFTATALIQTRSTLLQASDSACNRQKVNGGIHLLQHAGDRVVQLLGHRSPAVLQGPPLLVGRWHGNAGRLQACLQSSDRPQAGKQISLIRWLQMRVTWALDGLLRLDLLLSDVWPACWMHAATNTCFHQNQGRRCIAASDILHSWTAQRHWLSTISQHAGHNMICALDQTWPSGIKHAADQQLCTESRAH